LKTRIGHLLVRADLVTEAQLSRALEVQNFAGGRIGTLLLERAALGVDDLGKTLALQQGCGYVPWDALSSLSPETLAVLPPRLALKHNAIPYECGEGYVRMALRDPNDLRNLDELVFVTGRKVLAGVAPEVRIYQALEKYYGKVRAPRYAILAERLSRVQKVAVTGPSSPPPPPGFFAQAATLQQVSRLSPPPTPARESRGSSSAPEQAPATAKNSESPPAAWSPYFAPPPEPERPEETEEISWEDTTGRRSRQKTPDASPLPASFHAAGDSESADLQEAPEGPAPGPPEPPPEPGISRVLAATERDAIANAVLSALVPRFPSAAVLSSRSNQVTGWAAAGNEVDPEALRSFSISLAEPSVFLNALLSRSYYLGPLPSLRCHDGLAAALGGWPGECLVQPVFLGEKPVAFLYASSSSPGSFSESDLTFVQGLCNAASTALANAIRLKKREI
jgi:hypothetical protein